MKILKNEFQHKVNKTKTQMIINLKNLFFIAAILFSNTVIFAQNKYNLNFDEFNPEASNMPKGWFKWGNFKNISGEKINDNYVEKVGHDSEGKYSYINEKFINGDQSYTDKLKSDFIQPTETSLWEKALAASGTDFYLDLSAFKSFIKKDELMGATKLIGYSKETKKISMRCHLQNILIP